MRPSTIKGLLIDWGHTLVDMAPVETIHADQCRHLADLLAQHLDRDGLLPSAEATLSQLSSRIDASFTTERTMVEMDLHQLYRDCLAQHGLILSDLALEEVIALEHKVWARHLTVPEETVAAVAELRRRGYKLALVSNNLWRSPWTQVFPFLADGSFHTAILSSELGLRKPHPHIYAAALEALGLAPEEAVFVGDRIEEDIHGPKEFGIPYAVLTHEFRQEEDERQEADALIHRFADVLDLL